MAFNNYGMQAPGSYGMQMPGFDSMSSWGSGDVPNYSLAPIAGLDPLSGMKDVQIPGISNVGTGAQGGDWFSNLFSKDGPGATLLGGAGALASTFLGMKQYGLAKQTLAENKKQFQMNYDAQRQTTNTRLEDRQRARVASNAGAYQSVGDYMGANGIR